MIGNIAIGIVSLYCGPAYAACVAGGSQLWAGASGKSFDESNKIGLIAGATAFAMQQVGNLTRHDDGSSPPSMKAVGARR